MKDALLIDRSHTGFPISSSFNDWVIEGNDIKTIDGHDRKRQDLIKAIITEKGKAVPYGNYGSNFTQVVAQRATSDIGQRIADSFKDTFGYLQDVEESPLPSERFQRIVNLSISKTTDSREKRINLVVALEDGLSLDTSFATPA